ncbi:MULTISPECIES: alpha/beta fold hydrolase [unclassified Streptomyces]|uniref:alpha/beta fold hydrolase n=1 Tax=unclassified Streptomyces TaxID=2593676 RepID=UPI00225B6A34|nr:alpha/beta hydrolase [Streptomyces sp. NBC_00047]MCX5611520.1 alpha/beta hydrolase [Streptomyces sp. NBC_00047]
MTSLLPSQKSVTVRGSGPGLLLAHGAGSDVEDSYGPILESLAGRRTVIGPDYPGSGNNPLLDHPLSLDQLADHIVESAVQSGVHSFAISGFSMGVSVAVRAAVRHPERVTALVLSAGFARPNARLKLVIDTWRALGAPGGDSRVLASYLSLVVGGTRWLDERSHEEIEEQLELFSAGMPPGTDAQLALFDDIDVRADLARIAVPALVVSPLGDLLITPVHSRELADGIPGARLATLDCGHAIAAERPAEWAELITEFLAAVGG